jgi:hypothetical protein
MSLRLLWFGAFMALGSVAHAGNPPVDFQLLGIAPDHAHVRYKVDVKADKVSQVDFALKYLDADGKVIRETTVAWQNIVKSQQLPIDKGKSYDAQHPLAPNTAKCEAHLTMVHFSDGTRWSP